MQIFVIGFFLVLLTVVLFMGRSRQEPTDVHAADPEREKCGTPMERWLYDSLKMRGFAVKTKVPCGSYEISLALIEYKIAIQCEEPLESAPTMDKILRKQRERYLRSCGWRMIDIYPGSIYQDFRSKLRKIDLYIHN